MRIFLVPLLAYALAPADPAVEPSERAMRIAFEATLQTQVQNVLEFIEETSGAAAVTKLREAGADRFEVRTFRKLECMPDQVGHICNFSVDVSVANGAIEQTLKGRFLPWPDHSLTFSQDI